MTTFQQLSQSTQRRVAVVRLGYGQPVNAGTLRAFHGRALHPRAPPPSDEVATVGRSGHEGGVAIKFSQHFRHVPRELLAPPARARAAYPYGALAHTQPRH